MENGITLCGDHHIIAEAFLNGFSKDIRYSPDALYKLVGSSKEKAIKASNE